MRSYLDVSSDLVEALYHLDWHVDLIEHGLRQLKERLRVGATVTRYGHTEAVGVAEVHIDGADVGYKLLWLELKLGEILHLQDLLLRADLETCDCDY